MRLLIDANLSPRVSAWLRSAGFDAIHVADVGLVTAADETTLAYAAVNELVIISADSDLASCWPHRPAQPAPQ